MILVDHEGMMQYFSGRCPECLSTDVGEAIVDGWPTTKCSECGWKGPLEYLEIHVVELPVGREP